MAFDGPNRLIESAGMYGGSVIQFINLDDMNIENQHKLESRYFAEGADFVQDEKGNKLVYQLTWQERDV